MEPRSFDRGNSIRRCEPRCSERLQWSRDHLIAEMVVGAAEFSNVAVLQWSRDHLIAEIACRLSYSIFKGLMSALRAPWIDLHRSGQCCSTWPSKSLSRMSLIVASDHWPASITGPLALTGNKYR